MQEILKRWVVANPLGLNETLLAMKAYAPFHHLYATSVCFSISSGAADRVPKPTKSLERAQEVGLVDLIIDIGGTCLNTALEAAANEPQPPNRVFSPQNWIKAKTCLSGINAAVRQYFAMLPTMPGGKDQAKRLKEGLTLDLHDFEYRWAAD